MLVEVGRDAGIGQGAAQAPDGFVDLGARAFPGLPGGDAGAHIDRGGEVELVLQGVEDRENRGAHQQRVGEAKTWTVAVGQALHETDHLVAEVAVDAGGGRRQALGDVRLALGDERAKGVERRFARRARSRPRRRTLRLMLALPDSTLRMMSGSNPIIE